VPATGMEESIKVSLKAAADQDIKGKEVTPFLLQYLAEYTKGESLEANIALIKNNAALGALIANVYNA